MQKQVSLRETKQHGAVRFPFNIYPCTIPGDFSSPPRSSAAASLGRS